MADRDRKNCPMRYENGKGQKTVPEELDLKMWRALFAEEERCKKHFAETENNDLLFKHWLPWLRKGFGIAMTAIAEWEEGKADAWQEERESDQGA